MKIILLFLLGALFNTSHANEPHKTNLNLESKSENVKINDNDPCGCFLEVEAGYNENMATISWTHRHLKGSRLLNNSELNSNEFYNTYKLSARFYFSPKLQFGLTIPYSGVIGGSNFYWGPGDISLLSRTQIFNSSVDAFTEFRHRMLGAIGVKFPTGMYNQKYVSDTLRPYYQPGSGSFDFFSIITYIVKLNDFGFSAEGAYHLNTRNKNWYRFGNQFNTSISFLYNFKAGDALLFPNIGVEADFINKDLYYGIKDNDTGGKIYSVTAGLKTSLFSKLFPYFLIKIPFTQKLNGTQPEEKIQINAGIGFPL